MKVSRNKEKVEGIKNSESQIVRKAPEITPNQETRHTILRPIRPFNQLNRVGSNLKGRLDSGVEVVSSYISKKARCDEKSL